MKRVILGVAAALFLSVGQAAADGLPSKGYVKAPDAGPNWTGFYIGAGIGASSAVSALDINAGGFSIVNFDGFGSAGTFGTITVGYDRVLRPGWVGGVFADYDFGSTQATELTILSAFTIPLIELQNSWSVGARLGVLTSPSTLVYGTAGYTRTEMDILGGLGGALGLPTRIDGYFVGGGIETFLASKWTLKLEYRYTDYGSETLVDLGGGAIDLDTSTHSARAVLSYKFGSHH
jgi:outer membrane immunogenic protein